MIILTLLTILSIVGSYFYIAHQASKDTEDVLDKMLKNEKETIYRECHKGENHGTIKPHKTLGFRDGTK